MSVLWAGDCVCCGQQGKLGFSRRHQGFYCCACHDYFDSSSSREASVSVGGTSAGGGLNTLGGDCGSNSNLVAVGSSNNLASSGGGGPRSFGCVGSFGLGSRPLIGGGLVGGRVRGVNTGSLTTSAGAEAGDGPSSRGPSIRADHHHQQGSSGLIRGPSLNARSGHNSATHYGRAGGFRSAEQNFASNDLRGVRRGGDHKSTPGIDAGVGGGPVEGAPNDFSFSPEPREGGVVVVQQENCFDEEDEPSTCSPQSLHTTTKDIPQASTGTSTGAGRTPARRGATASSSTGEGASSSSSRANGRSRGQHLRKDASEDDFFAYAIRPPFSRFEQQIVVSAGSSRRHSERGTGASLWISAELLIAHMLWYTEFDRLELSPDIAERVVKGRRNQQVLGLGAMQIQQSSPMNLKSEVVSKHFVGGASSSNKTGEVETNLNNLNNLNSGGKGECLLKDGSASTKVDEHQQVAKQPNQVGEQGQRQTPIDQQFLHVQVDIMNTPDLKKDEGGSTVGGQQLAQPRMDTTSNVDLHNGGGISASMKRVRESASSIASSPQESAESGDEDADMEDIGSGGSSTTASWIDPAEHEHRTRALIDEVCDGIERPFVSSMLNGVDVEAFFFEAAALLQQSSSSIVPSSTESAQAAASSTSKFNGKSNSVKTSAIDFFPLTENDLLDANGLLPQPPALQVVTFFDEDADHSPTTGRKRTTRKRFRIHENAVVLELGCGLAQPSISLGLNAAAKAYAELQLNPALLVDKKRGDPVMLNRIAKNVDGVRSLHLAGGQQIDNQGCPDQSSTAEELFYHRDRKIRHLDPSLAPPTVRPASPASLFNTTIAGPSVNATSYLPSLSFSQDNACSLSTPSNGAVPWTSAPLGPRGICGVVASSGPREHNNSTYACVLAPPCLVSENKNKETSTTATSSATSEDGSRNGKHDPSNAIIKSPHMTSILKPNRRYAQVVATDLPIVLPITEENVMWNYRYHVMNEEVRFVQPQVYAWKTETFLEREYRESEGEKLSSEDLSTACLQMGAGASTAINHVIRDASLANGAAGGPSKIMNPPVAYPANTAAPALGYHSRTPQFYYQSLQENQQRNGARSIFSPPSTSTTIGNQTNNAGLPNAAVPPTMRGKIESQISAKTTSSTVVTVRDLHEAAASSRSTKAAFRSCSSFIDTSSTSAHQRSTHFTAEDGLPETSSASSTSSATTSSCAPTPTSLHPVQQPRSSLYPRPGKRSSEDLQYLARKKDEDFINLKNNGAHPLHQQLGAEQQHELEDHAQVDLAPEELVGKSHSGLVHVRQLEWGNRGHTEALLSEYGKVDFIIGSSLCYDEDHSVALLDTLLALAQPARFWTKTELYFMQNALRQMEQSKIDGNSALLGNAVLDNDTNTKKVASSSSSTTTSTTSSYSSQTQHQLQQHAVVHENLLHDEHHLLEMSETSFDNQTSSTSINMKNTNNDMVQLLDTLSEATKEVIRLWHPDFKVRVEPRESEAQNVEEQVDEFDYDAEQVDEKNIETRSDVVEQENSKAETARSEANQELRGNVSPQDRLADAASTREKGDQERNVAAAVSSQGLDHESAQITAQSRDDAGEQEPQLVVQQDLAPPVDEGQLQERQDEVCLETNHSMVYMRSGTVLILALEQRDRDLDNFLKYAMRYVDDGRLVMKLVKTLRGTHTYASPTKIYECYIPFRTT
ncbi:unnamed protein product [Amoebophrya sp. A25]|nr:unnamed protein product [Amoebophrya sp. A25]|eukprot:GSA25T00017492001.1